MNGLTAIARHSLQEAVRRRVVTVVSLLTLVLGGLYVLVAEVAFGTNDETPGALDHVTLVGSTLLGLAMFATLFLGGVLAVFLTLSAGRGGAERGVLQPPVVRPPGRGPHLLPRLGAAAPGCAPCGPGRD